MHLQKICSASSSPFSPSRFLCRLVSGIWYLVSGIWYLMSLALAQPYINTLQNGIVFGLLPVVLVYTIYSLWHSLRRR